MKRVVLKAEELQTLSLALADTIEAPPDFLVALWRGGAAIGCYVQEWLQHKFKTPIDNTCVRTARYHGVGQAREEVVVEGLEHVFSKVRPGKNRILIVDDVWDAGTTMAAVLEKLSGLNAHVQVAVVYWKPANNKTTLRPDYWLETTDAWIVLPHEVEGRTPAEIAALTESIRRHPALTKG